MSNNVLDTIKQGVGAGVNAISAKTEELTEIARLKAANIQLAAQQKQLTVALGEKLYRIHREGMAINEGVFAQDFGEIDEIGSRIEQNNALVEERKRQEAARQEAALAEERKRQEAARRNVCPACQSVNVPEAIFCKNCAQRLMKESAPTAAQGLFCKYCGQKNDPDAAFCESCGQKLK